MLLFATIGVLLATCYARNFDKCDGIIVGNINHDKEVLKEIHEDPYQLAIDYNTQTLFFSFTANDDLDEVFRSAYLNLKTNEYDKINGISGGFANAFDEKSNTVYLGGREGIYKFDYDTKTAVNLHITNHNIWQLHTSNGVAYYTTYPDEKLYKYEDGTVSLVPELADTTVLLAAVDENENIFFSNSTGLFCFKKNKNRVVSIGNYPANGFTKDIHGKIYFTTPNGIYGIDKQRKTVETLARIPSLFGCAFESNGNIIYATRTAIVRLTPSKTKCFIDYDNKIEDA